MDSGCVKCINFSVCGRSGNGAICQDFIEVPKGSNLNGWAHESTKSFCPRCGEMPLYDYWGRQKFSNYCPNCGKKMCAE